MELQSLSKSRFGCLDNLCIVCLLYMLSRGTIGALGETLLTWVSPSGSQFACYSNRVILISDWVLLSNSNLSLGYLGLYDFSSGVFL